MSLGSTIIKLRAQKRWKQKELAARLGVHPRHVSRWEKDQVRPRAHTLEKLAEVLEVPVTQLMESTELSSPTGVRPGLAEMLQQIHRLENREQEVLETFLEAIFTRIRMEEAFRRPA